MGNSLIKRIGIDLDNTVADYMAKAAPRLKDMFGIEPKGLGSNNPEAAFLWGAREKATPRDKWQELGLEPEDRKVLHAIRQQLYVDENFFRDLPMLEKDTNLLTRELQKRGHRVYFITARSRNDVIVDDTLFWLMNNGFAFDDVFFTNDKAQLCSMMDIRTLLEDDRNQIQDCLDKNIQVIGMACPWNEGIVHENFSRVNSWREMLAAVKER
jgi:uncharacterized HAD superfamily protein